MRIRLKLTMISLFLALASAACSSAPEVPEQSQAHQYQSTQAEPEPAQPTQNAQGAPAATDAQIPRAIGPIAQVNGEPISAEEFNAEIAKIVQSGQIPAQLLGHLKDQLINKMVDKALVDSAVDAANITVDDERVSARILEIQLEFDAAQTRDNTQMGSLEDMITNLGIDRDQFRDSVRESLAIEQLLLSRGMTYPSAAEIRAFYDENPDAFEHPEQFHARHILIRVDQGADEAAWQSARQRAEEIRQKATAPGADFAQIAYDFSEGPLGKQTGGSLGWFGRGQMVPEFDRAVADLKKNEISQPVRTQFGWHIIQKLDQRDAGQVPFEQVADQLENRLRNERVSEALNELLEELHETVAFEVYPENVQ